MLIFCSVTYNHFLLSYLVLKISLKKFLKWIELQSLTFKSNVNVVEKFTNSLCSQKTIVVKAIRHQINQTSNSQINRTLKTHLSRTTIQMRMPESTQLEYIPILFFAIYERKKNEYINNKYSERNGFRAERLCETHGDFFFKFTSHRCCC